MPELMQLHNFRRTNLDLLFFFNIYGILLKDWKVEYLKLKLMKLIRILP